MKTKLLILFACLIAACSDSPKKKSSDSANKDTPIVVPVTRVRVCRELPKNFWDTAPVDELFMMVINGDADADAAFDTILSRYDKDRMGTSEQYFGYVVGISKSEYGPRFVAHFLPYAQDFGDRTNSLATGVFLPIAKADPKADTLVEKLLTLGFSKVNQHLGGESYSDYYQADRGKQLLKGIFIHYEFAQYRDTIFSFFKHYGSVDDLEWFMLKFKEDAYWRDTAFQVLMDRTMTASGAVLMMDAYPRYAREVWDRASRDSICFGKNEMMEILNTSYILDEEVQYKNTLIGIQLACIEELAESGFFENASDVFSVTGKYSLAEYGEPEVRSVIQSKVLAFPFDQFSTFQLQKIVAHCGVVEIKAKAEKELRTRKAVAKSSQ